MPNTRFTGDLTVMLHRRRLIALMGAGAVAPFIGQVSAQESCPALPTETAGPFPADGSNKIGGSLVNVLTDSGLIREDMRPSFGSYTGTADGVLLDLEVTVLDITRDCTPLPGAFLYLWQNDASGRYSMYNLPDKNYLRAAAITDSAGRIRFRTIYPGCYGGRCPHTHFELFASKAAATSSRARLLTSQMAFPDDVSDAVYRDDARYAGSIPNFERTPTDRDFLFRNNTPTEKIAQTVQVDGSLTDGLRGSIIVGIDPSGKPA